MKKFILWFIGICAGLLFGAWLLLVILQHTVAAWPEPVPGVRLEPRRPILAEADVKPDNAYYYIRQMTNTGTLSSELQTETTRFSALGVDGGPYPALEAALKTEAKNLELAYAAAAVSDCQVPTVMDSVTHLPYLDTSKSTASLLLYRAESAAFRDDLKSVVADIRTVLVLGNYGSRGGTLINRLVGVALHSMADTSIRRIVFSQNSSPEFLKEMDAVLEVTERGLEPLDEGMRYEWKFARGILDNELLERMFRKSPFGGKLIWAVIGGAPWQVRKHVDAVYTHVIAVSANPATASITKETKDKIEVKSKLKMVLNDPMGRAFVNLMLPATGLAGNRVAREQVDLNSTRLILAIRRWQLEHDGKLPGTLGELVPGYISAVPEDPFSPKHEPLRYRTDGTAWAVYSVGKDGVDNGGRFSELDKEDKAQHPNELDLVFSSDEFQKKRAAYEKQKK